MVSQRVVAAVTKPGIGAWLAWNLAITALLALALLFQSAAGSDVSALVALVLAAFAFVMRWGVNALIWLRRWRLARRS